jgi:GrpB-like predicted nucleotidyltransferase (UPF0157 family)
MRSALGSIAKIEAAGYELRLGAGGPERIFFSRGPQSRHYHLHLTWKGTGELKTKLLFRNYLRKHPKAAAEYYRLKLRAAKKAGPDRRKYLGLKASFIEKVMRNAR